MPNAADMSAVTGGSRADHDRRERRSAALIAIGLAAGPVVALGFTRFAYALLLPAMRADLHWSFATAGGITTGNAVGYVIGAASAAWWAKRFGERRVFVLGMVVSALALLLTAVSGDYLFLTIIRFIGGLSTSVVFVVGSALASRIRVATAKQSSMLVSIYIAGVGVGIVLSGLVVPALLGWLGDTGWPAGWLAMGVLGVIAIWPAIVSSKYVDKPAKAVGSRASLKFLTPSFIWYVLYGAGYVSYLTFVIALVGEEGLSGWAIAAFFVVVGLSSALGTLLIWGMVIGRLGSAAGPAVVTLVVIAGVIPVLVWPGVVGAFVSAVIFGAGFMAGPTSATVTAKRFLPPASLTSGIAALTAAFSVGQAIGPVASGIVSDTPLGIVGGLWVSVFLLIPAGIVVLFQRGPRAAAQGDAVSTESAYWDERYAGSEQLWSGEPNSALVEAAMSRSPGRTLDVGCGEGADAVWLASHGWDVTALDVSGVALDRAARHAKEAGVSVTWIHAGLLDAPFASGSFDLVSAQYPVLARTPGADAERKLIDAVAPGGTLTVVHHADFQSNDTAHHGCNPADYVGPWDITALLDDGWQVEVNETRPRSLTTGAGAGHTEDVVLIARRLASGDHSG